MFVGEQAGKAEEAINFYTSLFEESAVNHVVRQGPEAGAAADKEA
jgi:predicted 3-demethylubiquinone-9 3-methyltransferase (glyoxalase superfamily)